MTWSRSARLVTMLCRNAIITSTLLLKSLIFSQWFIKIQLAKQRKTPCKANIFYKRLDCSRNMMNSGRLDYE